MMSMLYNLSVNWIDGKINSLQIQAYWVIAKQYMKQPLPTEHQEALALVQWLKMMDLPFTKIPNETYTKSWSQRHKNTVEGVSAGIPDYLIVIPHRYIVFIELKRTKSSPSQTSEAQLAWQKTLNTVPNVEAFVCKGAEQATSILTKIINGTYIR